METYDWQAVVKNQGPLVWQTAYRLLGDHADTADCFQETFAAAFEIASRQRVRNMAGLLVRLATMRAIDGLRRKSRREGHRAQAHRTHGTAGGGPDPLDEVEAQELSWKLREAIAQLAPQEGKVFCMRHLNEMSYRQIAKELNMKVNAVGVVLHRAKTRLRDALEAVRMEDEEVPHETR